MIVHKFGGTSLGNAERIASVAEIIEASRGQQPTVVVSALSGTTDRLIAGARAAALGDVSACYEAREWLAKIHHSTVESLLSSFPECQQLHNTIDERLDRLTKFLDSITVLGELTARGHDAVACLGEQLSAAMLRRSAQPTSS